MAVDICCPRALLAQVQSRAWVEGARFMRHFHFSLVNTAFWKTAVSVSCSAYQIQLAICNSAPGLSQWQWPPMNFSVNAKELEKTETESPDGTEAVGEEAKRPGKGETELDHEDRN